MHDPRVGRFFAVDPLDAMYPWNSPYAFSENRVLDKIELEGKETSEAILKTEYVLPALSKVSTSTSSMLTYGVSLELRAGLFFSAGAVGGAMVATDRFSNYAFSYYGGAFATGISDGYSTSDETPGVENGGSWYFGLDGGVSLDGGVRFGKYQHVSDLQGKESSLDIDLPFVDISAIKPESSGAINGIEASVGYGEGLGIGATTTEGVVFAFGPKTFDNMINVAKNAILTKKENSNNENIIIDIPYQKTYDNNVIELGIRVIEINKISGSIKTISEEATHIFTKENNFLYKTDDVNPKKD